MQIVGTWVQKAENGEELPFDIAEVIRGLWEMGYRDSGDDYDWIPSRVMRREYEKANPNGPRLSPQKFGVAVRLGYPPLSDKASKRCVRNVKGVPTRGVCGITGPGGKRTDDTKY